MSKIQIKSVFGKVIFEYECKNNTIKKTVEKAVFDKISLGSADLRSANLSSANLRSADLRSADLSSADLCSANLSSANLRLAKNKETAFIPLFCKWLFSIVGDKIQIGCEKRTIEEWDKFFLSKEVLSTQRNTEDFKQIQAIYLACKAYLTHLKN
jgi:hypothetical protein